MNQCVHCGSHRVRRSHLHRLERLRKRFTRKRPYRCDACGWRGWGVPDPLEEYAWHGDGGVVPRPDASDIDLTALDKNGHPV